MRTLYGVKHLPSDTYMRERLDELSPTDLRRSFSTCFAQLQRAKELEQFKFINDTYLLALDGTGVFESDYKCIVITVVSKSIKRIIVRPTIIKFFAEY